MAAEAGFDDAAAAADDARISAYVSKVHKPRSDVVPVPQVDLESTSARRERALLALRECHRLQGQSKLELCTAAFRVASRPDANTPANELLQGAAQASTWLGRGLLIFVMGDSEPSAWNEDYDAQEALLPGEEVLFEEPNFIAGERAYAYAYDRCISAVLASLWHFTDPVHGFAHPPVEAVEDAAAGVLSIVDDLLPSDALRAFARWPLTDDACAYLRDHVAREMVLDPLKTGDAISHVELRSFLVAVRFLRMAVRRSRAVSPAFVVQTLTDISGPSAESVDERRWEYGLWASEFAGPQWTHRNASTTTLASHAHACMLPRLTNISDTGLLFPLMYLMRYRSLVGELAWVRRQAMLFGRRVAALCAASA